MYQELEIQIGKVLSEAANKILLIVEASMPSEQFRAARKLILDELGHSGAKGKVHKIVEELQGAGKS